VQRFLNFQRWSRSSFDRSGPDNVLKRCRVPKINHFTAFDWSSSDHNLVHAVCDLDFYNDHCWRSKMLINDSDMYSPFYN